MFEAAVPTIPRPTAREVTIMREAVHELSQKLYKERFGIEPEPWNKSDDSALDSYLAISKFNPWPTVAEVESLLRAYFASDGIHPDRPYQWLPTLWKYKSGPLDSTGESKSVVAAREAELARQRAEATAKTARRDVAIAEEDEERRFEDARLKVTRDLIQRGYEVFKPIFPSGCHLLAVRKTVDTRSGEALRIVVRTGSNATRTDRRFYQVLVSQDPNAPIVFDPPLEEN
jgi:hypothetical protein